LLEAQLHSCRSSFSSSVWWSSSNSSRLVVFGSACFQSTEMGNPSEYRLSPNTSWCS
jgi:hypothetical protein